MTPDYTKLPYPVTGEWLYNRQRYTVTPFGSLVMDWDGIPEDIKSAWESLATLINTHIAELEARLANCVEIPSEERWRKESPIGVTIWRAVWGYEREDQTFVPIKLDGPAYHRPKTLAERRAALIAKIKSMDADELAKLEEVGK